MASSTAPARAAVREDIAAPPRHRGPAVAVFLLLVGVYGLTAGGHTYSSDEETMYAVTQGLSRGHWYIDGTDPNKFVTAYRLGRGNHVVTYTALGSSLAGFPLYVVGTVLARSVPDVNADNTRRVVVGWTNSFVEAAAVAMVFLIASLLGARRRWAVVLALAYGIGTMAWAYAKTPLLSEPLATLLTLCTVYFAIKAGLERAYRPLLFAGGFAALSMVARPNTVLFAPVVGGYLLAVFFRHGGARDALRAGVAFAAGAAGPGLSFLASNWLRYGSPFDWGVPHSEYLFKFPVNQGLYSLFLSPGKGVFLYAPPVLLGIAAAAFVPRARRAEIGLLAGVAMVNALLFAVYKEWHGDHAWGPRYLSVSVPLFVVMVAPLLDRARWRRALVGFGAVGVAVTSLAVIVDVNAHYTWAGQHLHNQWLATGPTYWPKLHYDARWSPIVGHARLVSEAVTTSEHRLLGQIPPMPPLPQDPGARYDYFLTAGPQVDNWMYWNRVTHGSRKLLLFAPLFAIAGVAGGVRLRAQLASDSP